ncbi:MAG: hypothetical protein HGA47_00770 [Zoogloea sp.]|nr:hypothetical protein [Zoogloea sp.]
MRYLNVRHCLLRSCLLVIFAGCHLFVATASAQWMGDRSKEERSHDRHPRQFEPPRFAPEPQRTNDAEEQRGGRRLSPEERRQLRRDIHDAGRDIYGERPRRF